jgi:hypothetical protein
MVHQDYWAIGQWYAHYGKHIGYRNLYIIAHGDDSKIADICPLANIITIPRDELKNFDRVRARLMNGIQSGLGNIFDWVIQTDADELVCFNPSTYRSFAELFESTKAPALFALGLNLAEMELDPPLEYDESPFPTRTVACITGNYSKAWAVKKALPLRWHGVFCGYRKTQSFPFEMPDDVFFVHLKHANSKALQEANSVRQSVADAVGESWNVSGWSKPDYHAKRFYRKMAAARALDWEDAIALGYSQIRDNPVRDPERGVVKPPFIQYVCRTVLPDWFRAL